MQVSPSSLPGPRLRRQPSSMGVSGFPAQAITALAQSPMLKPHVVNGNVYSNGQSSTSLGQTAASPSSPVVARTISPLHSKGHSTLARPASPLKGQQGYVTRRTSTANSNVTPPGGASQSSLVPPASQSSLAPPRRHVSPRTQPNNTSSPPVPSLMQPSHQKSMTPQVMRRSSCPPPSVRTGQGKGGTSRASNGPVMAKIVTAEPLSPARGMRQLSAISAVTPKTSSGGPNFSTVGRGTAIGSASSTSPPVYSSPQSTTGFSKALPAVAPSPHRPARFSTGALTARGRGASAVTLGDVAAAEVVMLALEASPRSGHRAMLPSTLQSTGGLPHRISPRESGGAARRAVSREEMISSGRLRQTIHSSPRAHYSNGGTYPGAAHFVNDLLLTPMLERREALPHGVGGLRSADSDTASVITLPGPIAESNDFSQDLAGGRIRLIDAALRQLDVKDNTDMSPRSALTNDVPTEPGMDLQCAELLSPRTEPPC